MPNIINLRQHLPAAICAIGIFYAAALPLIWTGADPGRAGFDQSNYHYPAIQHFYQGMGIDDYPSASTPGYYVLMAAIAHVSSMTPSALKLCQTVITSIMIGILACYLATILRKTGMAVMLLLPMIFSIYIFPAGVWLLPDNLSWLLVLISVSVSGKELKPVLKHVLQGTILLAAVFVRQSNIWLAAVWFAAILSEADGSETWVRNKLMRALTAIAAAIPAILLLVYFHSIWDGPVPPSFAGRFAGPNPAAVPFFLALTGFYGLFYAPVLFDPLLELYRKTPRAVRFTAAASTLGLAASLLTPTTMDYSSGRVSGLWVLTRFFPVIFDRSVLISILAMTGAGLLSGMLMLLEKRSRWMTITGCAAFLLIQTFAHFVYERYYAGFVFFLFLLISGEVARRDWVRRLWPGFLGSSVFTLFNIAVLIKGLID